MKAKIITLDNAAAGEIDLADEVFGVAVRKDIMSRMVNYQLAKRRAGTHKVKGRSEVNGSTAKIYRQKGTGRARHGDKKAPQFRGGGQVFIYRRMKLHMVIVQEPLGPSEFSVDPAQRRAAITGHVACGVQPGGQVALTLHQGQADQRLGAGQEHASFGKAVFIVQADGA